MTAPQVVQIFLFISVRGGLASNQHFQSFFFQPERVNRLGHREGHELSNVFCQNQGPIKQIIKYPLILISSACRLSVAGAVSSWGR